MADAHMMHGMDPDMPMPDDDPDMPMPPDDPDMPMPMPMPMVMTMYFYQSEKVKFLFDSYNVSSDTGYFGVCMVAFFFGFVTETLSIVQDRLDQQISSKIKEEQKKMRARRCS